MNTYHILIDVIQNYLNGCKPIFFKTCFAGTEDSECCPYKTTVFEVKYLKTRNVSFDFERVLTLEIRSDFRNQHPLGSLMSLKPYIENDRITQNTAK